MKESTKLTSEPALHDTMTVKMNFAPEHPAAITTNGRRNYGTSLTTLLVLVAVASALSRPVDADVMSRMSANAPERRQVYLVQDDAQPGRGGIPRSVRPCRNHFPDIRVSDISAGNQRILSASVCRIYLECSVRTLNATVEEFQEQMLNLPPPVYFI